MKNILITGANGQVGLQFKKIYSDEAVVFATKNDLDISDFEDVKRFFDRYEFSGIINCAAYTAVDQAETNEKECFRVNSLGVEILAKQSATYKIPLIHISTDYVFDGHSKRPYLETDTTHPLSVYGRSKLEGENKFLEFAHSGAVVRTSWVFSEDGKNFFVAIKNLVHEKKELTFVSDQFGTPTYSKDLAKAIIQILKNPLKEKGVFHFSNQGTTSRFDFVVEIRDQLHADCDIKPILTSQYPTPATRPLYSVLNKDKIASTFHLKIRDWKEALQECIHNQS